MKTRKIHKLKKKKNKKKSSLRREVRARETHRERKLGIRKTCYWSVLLKDHIFVVTKNTKR